MQNPSLPEPQPSRPAVLYMPLDDLDVSAGRALLDAAGIALLDLEDGAAESELADVVAVLVGYDRVDSELFDRLPALRLVATHSAGVDMVDVDEVRRRGLWLANLPGGATEEVASHALAMALALVRQLPRFDRRVRAGVWEEPALPLPRVPAQLTCAVLGLGRIGQAFARMAGPLFGRVVGYDPGLRAEAWPEGVDRYDEVAAVLGTADCVSLHLPLTRQTRHLLDARTIALLPEGAVVVNVSRGDLVDTAALVDALHRGHLGGAACDVFEHEPPDPAEPLLGRTDVLLSPHVAYLSEASLRRYAETPARNVLALLESGRPLTPVVTPG